MTYSNGDVLRVTARMQNGADDLQNVYHFRIDGMTSDTTNGLGDGAIMAELDSWYQKLVPIISDSVSFVDIIIQNLTEGTPARSVVWPTVTAGTDAGTDMPGQISGLVLFPSDKAKSLGRKYIPGVKEESSADPGVPVSAYLTGLSNFAADVITMAALNGGTLFVGNWSEEKGRFATWIAANVMTYWATQRRRRTGVGS